MSALRYGGQGYILKADARAELLPAIQAALLGEKVLSKRLKR
jgi:hypothetical protein